MDRCRATTAGAMTGNPRRDVQNVFDPGVAAAVRDCGGSAARWCVVREMPAHPGRAPGHSTAPRGEGSVVTGLPQILPAIRQPPARRMRRCPRSFRRIDEIRQRGVDGTVQLITLGRHGAATGARI